MSQPITCIIVGAGHRAQIYGSYAIYEPDKFKIVGVADPDPIRRRQVQETHGFSDEFCFESAADLAAVGERLADAIINGTMDQDHVHTSVPLLDLGYDLLLEKPFALSPEEVYELSDTAQRNNSTVMICHVLRYAPFYVKIKELIDSGLVGDISRIEATEHVSYHHTAVSFVRGKWGNRSKCGAGMLLAKCCHDIDLILWLKGQNPKQVSSFASAFIFDPKKKPEGAGTRCLNDCAIEENCLYSARKHYLDHPDRWSFYVWTDFEDIENPTLADKEASLKSDNPHGCCVWDCDYENVDNQSVMMQFEDNSVGVLNMVGGSSKSERQIHILGTKGEIKGIFDDNHYVIRKIVTEDPIGYVETAHDTSDEGDTTGVSGGHGGGDLRLVADFVSVLQGNEPSPSATTLRDSVYGHMTVFAAEEAAANLTVIPLAERITAHEATLQK